MLARPEDELRLMLVPEVAHSREDHRQPRIIGGSNYFIVADRTAGLDHGRRTGFDRGQQAVGEGEEGIRSYS